MVELYALISKTSPRYPDWVFILGSDEAPIMSSSPVRGSAPGLANALFYKLDLLRISEEQRLRLVLHISALWNLDCEIVERELVDPAHGLAIPADDVMIVLDGRMMH